jgi:hypothetical protein
MTLAGREEGVPGQGLRAAARASAPHAARAHTHRCRRACRADRSPLEVLDAVIEAIAAEVGACVCVCVCVCEVWGEGVACATPVARP